VQRLLIAIAVLALTLWAQDLTAIHDPEQAASDSTRALNLAKQTLNTDSLDALTANRDAPDTIEYSAVDLEYDFPTQTFNLNDKALIKYRGATLTGDTVWFDQGKQVLQASGEPVLKDPKNPPLSGYRMKYNMKSRIGQVFYGSSFRDNQRFNGMDIRRLPDSRMQLSRGDFSTCNDSVEQHYFFYARRMTVTPKENIVASPVVLNIEGVPVAVLPLLVAPLKSGRRSGLLTPKFGGDQKQGFYLRDLGLYWAINDYMDWIGKGDIVEGDQAKFERSTLNTQFRYKELYKLDGNIDATAYLQEFNLANSGWDIKFLHNQDLRPDGRSKLSGEGSFVSSNTIRKDRSLDQTTILDRQANARMSWNRTFQNNRNLILKFRQDRNLQTGKIEREIPDLQLRSSGPLLPFVQSEPNSGFTGVLQRFNYSASNESNYFYRQDRDSLNHADTSRYWLGNTINGGIDWSGQIFDVFNLTPKLSYRGDWTAYRYTNPNDSIIYRQPTWDADVQNGQKGEYFGAYTASIGTDTKLFGIWRPEWGRFVGVRHTLSPGVSYTFTPHQDTLKTFVPHPLLGQTPWQTKQKSIGFSLGNDFDIKYLTFRDTAATGDGSANLKLLSSRHTTSYNFSADSLQWSPISSSFGIQVIPDYLFSINTQHWVYHRYSDQPAVVQLPELTSWGYELSRSFSWNGKFNAGVPMAKSDEPELRPWSAGFDYRYSFTSNRVGRSLFQETITHSSTIHVSLQPTRKWKMTYATQYDYTEGRFAQHTLTFDRDLHCWSMNFTWTPVGVAAGWHFSIFITELPDIKLQSGDTKTASSSK